MWGSPFRCCGNGRRPEQGALFGEILSVVEGCGFLLKLSCKYFSCLEFKTRDGNFKVVWIVHPDFFGHDDPI